MKRKNVTDSSKQPKFIRTPSSSSGTVHDVNQEGSIQVGREYFSWLISPMKLEQFFASHWEKTPILLKRADNEYYKKLLSAEQIDEVLRNNIIEFSKNIDVTSYKNGVRETHNPEGRAMPSQIWNLYDEGCSIRFLNPQTYIPALHELNASMQEFFHSFVGANLYLTPPNNQGFAPHYDDIEAFVLQIEGKKKWSLYSPPTTADILARESSENFTQDYIGEPILETILTPGDVLYFPRGVVHQAHTVPGSHSLHITISVYQKNAYADLLETLTPNLLQKAFMNNIQFRQGLPLNIWQQFGFIYSDKKNSVRNGLFNDVKELLHKAVNELDANDLDEVVDQLAIKYQHDALPPYYVQSEIERTVYGTKHKLKENGKVKIIELSKNAKFRLTRANILRMVKCEEALRIYYHADNTKEYHEVDMNFIEVEEEAGILIEDLIKNYPIFQSLDDLPQEMDPEVSIGVLNELWSRGLLMTDKPL